MMVYSSLQAEFMVTKYDGHIHRYGALVFGKLVIYVSILEYHFYTVKAVLYVKCSIIW